MNMEIHLLIKLKCRKMKIVFAFKFSDVVFYIALNVLSMKKSVVTMGSDKCHLVFLGRKNLLGKFMIGDSLNML